MPTRAVRDLAGQERQLRNGRRAGAVNARRGQRAVLRRKTRHQIRVVRLHQPVRQRALGNMASVGRRGRLRGRYGAGTARRCASLQCGEAQHEARLYSIGCTVFRAASSPPIGVCPVHGWNISAAQRRKSPACCCCPRRRFPEAGPVDGRAGSTRRACVEALEETCSARRIKQS